MNNQRNYLNAKIAKLYAKVAKPGILLDFLCDVFPLRLDFFRFKKLACFLLLFQVFITQAQKNLVQYVNPFVGTAGHAHTFPGACYPFGMMQLSPDTRVTGWDGCSGYYYADDTIYGFTHTHLSGTGCSDYGDILLMPISRRIDYIPRNVNMDSSYSVIGDYSSTFSHKDENASPGYYSVVLKNGNIKAELTVGQYAGMHRYIYQKDSACDVVLDLQHRNTVLHSYFHKISNTEVCGYRETSGWTKDKCVYFDIQFSKPMKECTAFKDDILQYGDPDQKSKNIKEVFSFNHSDTILVKIGISAISVANAKENLEHDIPAWDFDGTLKKTQQAWNSYLNKIEVTSKNDSLLTTFYTALYHTAIHPSLYTDVNGEYRGRDNKTHIAKGFEMYTVFSLWDTYRSLHPLLTIIDSSIDRQFVVTFLKQYEQGGALPVWELSANETNCMIGYHCVSVIYDAYQKGIRGFDAKEALEAMKSSVKNYARGYDYLEEYEYIPANKAGESVSQTLECSYDDWCVAQMAKALGDDDDYQLNIYNAQCYKNVFNPNNDFMQGRENGRFCEPFDPRAVTFNYTEANAWQYNFYAPHDMSGLIRLYGSKEKLAAKLDTLFTTTSQMPGRQQPDITGMIGQYAQGNEPSHHMAYLYNYVGQPWKTAEYVHEIEKFYTPKPDGICGNDDCGALSAWYVMSAMGLYQVCPGDGQFELTTPLFDTIRIHLENGKTFSIISHENGNDAYAIQYAKLNGKYHGESYLKYVDLMKGGQINYSIGYTPFDNRNQDSSTAMSDWGTENVPVDSIPAIDSIAPLPYLEYGSAIFEDSTLISMKAFSPKDTVFFDTTHNLDMQIDHPFIHSFYIHRNTWLTFWRNRKPRYPESLPMDYRKLFERDCDAGFTKITSGRKIKILSKPNSQYTAGGPGALLDFQYGSSDFRLGKWQGYQYTDFEAVIDLGKVESISNVSANFLQDALSYIYMPTYVDFSVSIDSIHFTPVAHVVNTLADTIKVPTIKTSGKSINAQQARYVKVFAKNYGQLPKWHPGYPDSAFIFIDEIEIK